jgi:SAM-dependent methyltransferase
MQFDGESLITREQIASEFASPGVEHRDGMLVEAKAKMALMLSMARDSFEKGRDPTAITERIAAELHKARAKYHPSVWQELIPIVQNHPVTQYFHQDPFTRWSFDKPRGYSGDAQLLDFIYGQPSAEARVATASPLGRVLYESTRASQSSAAVRERRSLLARHVDEIAETRGSEAEILAAAAGHLREAELSTAFQERRMKRWVALDQDPLSIGAITRDFRGTPVEAIDGSVRGLLTDSHELGTFDFVYAAGLYDYLPRAVAVKLTRKCMRMLKPNGVFLFANFAEGIPDDGFMETFMNWTLLLRTEADMWNIINASVDRNTVEASVEFGENRNIVYGVIHKRS